MKKQVIICDRCGKETDGHKSPVVWQRDGQSIHTDLCETCEEKLFIFLTVPSE